jgi:DNA-binding LacI/PurR family transcriptional regulator
MNGAFVQESLRRRRSESDYSYKFQRLREKIRQAVTAGELTGKLPGERELARRFHVNAKTLSKALTDLAAEGLLARSIGRGTFVKGQEAQPTATGPWLLLCDADQLDSPVTQALRRHNPEAKAIQDITSLRPSFLNQFTAVVDLAASTPDVFVRDLLVRNMPLVVVGREPQTYSTSAVLLDVPYLASQLGRDLLLAGHRRLAAVESTREQSEGGVRDAALTKTLRLAASRYAPEATVVSCLARDAVRVVEGGVSAFVCSSVAAAQQVTNALFTASLPIPNRVSVCAVGEADGDYPCSGFYLSSEQAAEAVTHLLRNSQGGGGSKVLWLTGQYVDRYTTAVAPAEATACKPVMSLTA